MANEMESVFLCQSQGGSKPTYTGVVHTHTMVPWEWLERKVASDRLLRSEGDKDCFPMWSVCSYGRLLRDSKFTSRPRTTFPASFSTTTIPPPVKKFSLLSKTFGVVFGSLKLSSYFRFYNEKVCYDTQQKNTRYWPLNFCSKNFFLLCCVWIYKTTKWKKNPFFSLSNQQNFKRKFWPVFLPQRNPQQNCNFPTTTHSFPPKKYDLALPQLHKKGCNSTPPFNEQFL